MACTTRYGLLDMISSRNTQKYPGSQDIEKAFSTRPHCILHAGDIGHHGGHEEVLRDLDRHFGVPTYAVRGNVDDDKYIDIPATRVVHINGFRIMLTHIVNMPPRAPCAHAAQLISSIQPDIVVFGHSHQHGEAHAHGIWYINPGVCVCVDVGGYTSRCMSYLLYLINQRGVVHKIPSLVHTEYHQHQHPHNTQDLLALQDSSYRAQWPCYPSHQNVHHRAHHHLVHHHRIHHHRVHHYQSCRLCF